MKTEIIGKSPQLIFLQGGGEMGELIRSYNWSQSIIGPPGKWPECLRIATSILLNSQFPMFVWWGPERLTIYNDAYRVILAEKHPNALGGYGPVVWAEIWDVVGPLADKVMAEGVSTWAEDQILYINRHGYTEETYFTFSYSPILSESGKPAGVFCACTETTEKVLSAKKLKESELFARNIIMNSEAAQIVWTGKDMVFQMVNPKMLEILGRDDSILGKPFMEAIPELKNTPLLDRLRKVLDTGETYFQPEEMFLLMRHGKPHTGYYHYSYKPLQNADGVNYGIICTAFEVTNQVFARKKLEESERNFRNLVLQAPVGICIVKAPSVWVEEVNELFLKLVGRKREELEHKNYWEVLKEAKEYYAPILQNVFETGISYTGNEHRVALIRNGIEEIVYVNFVYEPIKDEQGLISKVMMLGIEVTAQVLSRKKIEEAEERVRLAINVSQLGLFEVDLVTDTIIASPRLEEMFDIEHTRDRGRFLSAIYPDDMSAREEAYKLAYKTGLLEYEGRVIQKDGSVRWVRSRGKVFFDENNKPLRLIGVSQDVTEQKEFEEELNKQVKQRTLELQNKNAELERSNNNLEEFAHAASHDLKEPIRKIHFFTDRLKNQLAERLTEDEKITFNRIESSTRRMGLLIDDLLQYSSVSYSAQEKESVDLNEKLIKVLEDLDLNIQQKAAIIEVRELPKIRGYRRQLQQMFQNLLSNALKYSKADIPPHIIISSEIVSRENGDTFLVNQGTAEEYHLIKVTDNGIGFEKENAEKIFQMFQRLHGKTEYGGTGVGLSIARKVAENHFGTIIAESEPGVGSTFKIYLPVLVE